MSRAPQVFISCDPEDEALLQEFVEHLALLEREGQVEVWHRGRFEAGTEWLQQAKDRLQNADFVLVLITAGYVASSCWEEDFRPSLKRHELGEARVVLVLARPFDWHPGHILWDLPVLPTNRKPIVQEGGDRDTGWAMVVRDLREMLLDEPNESNRGARERKEHRGGDGPSVQIHNLPVTGEQLIGRQKDLERLDRAWEDPDTHIFCIEAWGGVGKSALVNGWRARMAQEDWRGAERVFGWSFFSQGLRDTAASSAPFIDEALDWFGEESPALSEWERGQQVADLARKHRTLLLLDGLEPLQYPPGPQDGRLKDQAMQALLEALADQNQGLCLVTTRYRVANLNIFQGKTVHSLALENLDDEAGAKLLQTFELDATKSLLQEVSRQFEGHALALNLLGAYIRDAWEGDVVRCLKLDEKHLGPMRKIEAHLLEDDGADQASQIMATYQRWLGKNQRFRELAVLNLMGLFDRMASAEEIYALRSPPSIPGLTDHLADLPRPQWNRVIRWLREARLLFPKDPEAPGALDAHPLVREYFSRCLRQGSANTWAEGHLRLYEYLKGSTEKAPKTLAGLVPLYTAMAHGCYAGAVRNELFDDALNAVYRERILRSDNFSTRKLGALGADFGALYGFFDEPFTRVTSALNVDDRVFVLRQTGYCLRAQGRLWESVDCLKLALLLDREREEWGAAAVDAGLISQIHLTSGHLDHAISRGEEAVELADRGDDPVDQLKQRTALAYMKHQAGRIDEATVEFQRAMDRRESLDFSRNLENQTAECLVLFHYGDFLVGQGAHHQAIDLLEPKIRDLRITQRSRQAIALVQLVLGRAYLAQSSQKRAGDLLQKAVDGIRQAGREDCLPLVLLARADHRLAVGNLEGAQQDIHETLRLVERGRMSLYRVDALLAEARVHLKEPEKQGLVAAHLKKVGDLIQETGYRRRASELQFVKSCLG